MHKHMHSLELQFQGRALVKIGPFRVVHTLEVTVGEDETFDLYEIECPKCGQEDEPRRGCPECMGEHTVMHTLEEIEDLLAWN